MTEFATIPGGAGGQAVGLPPMAQVQGGFMGGFDAFLGGVSDTFDTLLQGAINFEQFRQIRDGRGQGQADVVTAVEKPQQPNAAPISAEQYRAIAEGARQSKAGFEIDQNAILIGGAVLVGLVLLLRA